MTPLARSIHQQRTDFAGNFRERDDNGVCFAWNDAVGE
jgi:hypothetical protein